jgi:hypothetical protein
MLNISCDVEMIKYKTIYKISITNMKKTKTSYVGFTAVKDKDYKIQFLGYQNYYEEVNTNIGILNMTLNITKGDRNIIRNVKIIKYWEIPVGDYIDMTLSFLAQIEDNIYISICNQANIYIIRDTILFYVNNSMIAYGKNNIYDLRNAKYIKKSECFNYNPYLTQEFVTNLMNSNYMYEYINKIKNSNTQPTYDIEKM